MAYKRETGKNGFQSHVIETIKRVLPGCIVLKNDSSYLQGIPDLAIFYGNKYAMLECKRGEYEPHQPNQDYYVDLFSKMSYSAFIFPENEEQIISELVGFMQQYH